MAGRGKDYSVAMRRMQRISGHIYGRESDAKPLWAQLMDDPQSPTPKLPKGASCRCSIDKWRYVCRCYPCLEHDGRVADFEWTADLIPTPASSGSDSRFVRNPQTARPSSRFKDGEEPNTVVLNGLTRHTSPDGAVVGPLSPAVHTRFSGISTYARLPLLSELRNANPEKEGPVADIAVLGVPFDSGCSFRPGARFGPEAVRAHSRLLRPFFISMRQRPLLEWQVADAGDVPVSPFGIEKATTQIYEDCMEQLNHAKRLVLIGGDHTLSHPGIKAAASKFGPVVLIHFDSHLDTFPPMYGQDLWHGSPFRCCWDDGLLAKDGSTHIGIRSTTYSPQDFKESDGMGITTLTAEDVHERGVEECLEFVRGRIEDLAPPGAPVYLSIDIDVLDPSVAPGTGTPEFGGLLAHQLLRFVRGLRGLRIVGADLVEIAPAYDHAGITAMAGAHLVAEMIALVGVSLDADSQRL